MTRHKKRIILLLFSISFLFCACQSLKKSGRKIEFFTLSYVPFDFTDRFAPLPVIIKVESFQVAPPYDTEYIIHQDRSFKKIPSKRRQWKDNPGNMVANFLIRDLKQSGLFDDILSPEAEIFLNCRVKGSVDEFFEWEAEESCKAVLFLSIILNEKNERETDEKVLLQRTYSTSKLCKSKNQGAVAEAMSEAMKELSGKIIEDIYESLKDRY